MTQRLHPSTSTLMIKLPVDIEIPTFQDKPRIRKAILRNIIQTLQTKTLELMYVGPQGDADNDFDVSFEGITVTVNVLNDTIYNFNLSQQALLKRFKKELQINNEHILIDNTTFHNGMYQRKIEIYIKSYLFERTQKQEYTFVSNSRNYNYLSA